MTKQIKRHKSLPPKDIHRSSESAENEYNLEKNIKKINSISRKGRNRNRFYNHITDSNEDKKQLLRNDNLIEYPYTSEMPLRTGDNTTWNPYIRLEDKITDFNDKNNQAHTDLRKELEKKIKDSNNSLEESIKECRASIAKRLHIQWYIWTIVGLVTIVSIWYRLSYIDVHPLPQKIENINERLKNVEKKISTIQHDTINIKKER